MRHNAVIFLINNKIPDINSYYKTLNFLSKLMISDRQQILSAHTNTRERQIYDKQSLQTDTQCPDILLL